MDSEFSQPEFSVIIPAFNEEDGLAVVLEKVFLAINQSFEVIIVDDGSTDRTAEVAVRYPGRLIQHKRNRGKGVALRTGIAHAQGRYVIWIDADDTYPPEIIPQIASALTDSYDLVFVSRRWGREHIPFFNRIGNVLSRWIIRTLYGFRPFDPCSGLCGVRKGCLKEMGLRAEKFSIEAEIAMKAGRMQLRMLDIPVEYRPRIGQTKLNWVKAGFEFSAALLGCLLWRPNGNGTPRNQREDMSPG